MERSRQQRSNRTDEEYTPEEAQDIWREASFLQAEAAEQLEERSRGLARLQAEEDEASGVRRIGLTPSEVRHIGEEAGISREFVDLAIAKLKSAAAAEGGDKNSVEWAEEILGYHERSLEVSRTMSSSADKVFDAMKRILPGPRYGLELVDVFGDGSLEDTILVFKIPSIYTVSASGTSYTPFSMSMAYSDVNRLYVSVHSLAENSCQVTMRMDLNRSKRRNAIAATAMSSIFAVFLATAATALSGFSSFTALAPIWLVTLAIVFYFGIKAYQPLYRWSTRKGVNAVEELLKIVDVDAKTSGSFSPRQDAVPKNDPLSGLF